MDLKSTLVYKFFSNLTYPYSLIPKRNYKLGIVFDELLTENQNFVLVRRSNLPIDKTFKKLGDKKFILSSNAIEPKSIINLSVNLYGNDFKTEYLKYKLEIKTFPGEKWDGKRRISFLKYLGLINRNEVGCSIFINGNKTHNKSYPYGVGPSKQLTSFLTKNNIIPDTFVDENGVTKNLVKGICRYQHDPLNFNYWHVEYVISDFMGEIQKKHSKNWHDEFCKSVLDNIISNNSSPFPPKDCKIGKHHYCK